MAEKVSVGLIGCGVVGGGLVRALSRNGSLMASRLGAQISVDRIAVRDITKNRDLPVAPEVFTTDWKSIATDPQIQLVVELVGGTDTAREMILTALKHGKSVITANKALICEFGEELFAEAEKNGVNLYYEASVAGGIPIIKTLREGLIGNRVQRLYGILNGTCNYILTQMKTRGWDFDHALGEAQRLGYAEADPALDVDGHDTAHKAGILASLSFGFWVSPDQVHTEGIRGLNILDIQFASRMGYTLKLLAMVKPNLTAAPRDSGTGQFSPVQVTVFPTLLPEHHVLANVNGVFNAVFVQGDVVGETLYYGPGAGADATASAVLSDLADAALDIKCDSAGRVPAFTPHEEDGSVLDIDSVVCPFYLRLQVMDRPGTMARIASILGGLNIGISSMFQPEGHEGDRVPLVLMIHDARHDAMKQALKQIGELDVVHGDPVMIRVEPFDPLPIETETETETV